LERCLVKDAPHLDPHPTSRAVFMNLFISIFWLAKRI